MSLVIQYAYPHKEIVIRYTYLGVTKKPLCYLAGKVRVTLMAIAFRLLA